MSENGETFDPFSVSAALSQAGKCPFMSLWCFFWVCMNSAGQTVCSTFSLPQSIIAIILFAQTYYISICFRMHGI